MFVVAGSTTAGCSVRRAFACQSKRLSAVDIIFFKSRVRYIKKKYKKKIPVHVLLTNRLGIIRSLSRYDQNYRIDMSVSHKKCFDVTRGSIVNRLRCTHSRRWVFLFDHGIFRYSIIIRPSVSVGIRFYLFNRKKNLKKFGRW